jgi:hypothetical protein
MKYLPIELQTHTLHSDGSFSPNDLVSRVKKVGLSGFSLTDHNTSSGCSETGTAAQKEGLIFLPGIEWTTFYGHMTVIGGKFDPDYRQINPFTIESRIRLAKESGDLTFLAHPFRVGTPVCTGCSDQFAIQDFSSLTGYEIWSGEFPGTSESNKNAVKSYFNILEKGYKLAAVYGRDWHRDTKEDAIFAATYVATEKENTEGVIQGLKLRNTYVSTGVKAFFFLKSIEGKNYYLGESVPPGKYVLVCEIEKDKKCYSCYEVIPKTISLVGNSLGQEITSNISYGGFAKTIEIGEGFLAIKISGLINDIFSDILISSPFFVGY